MLLLRTVTEAYLTNFCLVSMMKKIFARPIDFTKVDTLVYHLPDGPSFSMEMNDIVELFNFEMEFGDICDTSDIDGVIHFFPKGNA